MRQQFKTVRLLNRSHFRSLPLGRPATTSNFVISDPANSKLPAVPRCRRLVIVLSSRKPGFDPNPVCVGFMSDAVALRLVFSP